MIVSYKLLQTYFLKKLPKPEVIADALTFHSFEIEGMEKKGDDVAIDVKVLPNRAHDCLSHHGIAHEVSAILNIPLEKIPTAKWPKSDNKTLKLNVDIKDKRTVRYIGLVIDGIKVTPSPKWLADHLATLGQRSINNVVDATNYVMFMTGQPLHAFDYAKVTGGKIVVRQAKDGEKLTTLDGKEVLLDEKIMVIADMTGPLAIAGIKGGTKAEVDANTTTVILEAANFDASTVRMTSQRLGIKTDASKRFESGLSPYTAEDAMKMVAHLICDIAGTPNTRVGKPIDKFIKKPKVVSVSVSLHDINHILGTNFSDREVQSVWKRLALTFKTKKQQSVVMYTIAVPYARLDLRIKQDLMEEVGRIMGYHKLPPTMPIEPVQMPEVNHEWYCRDIVREVLLGAGFSDVYTYAFIGQGEIELANPIASDKKYLRNKLMNGLKAAVAENLKYESEVRMFEFGHVFGKTDGKLREESSFAALVGFQKRNNAQMKEDFYVLKGVLETTFTALGVHDVRFEEAGGELVASIFAEGTPLGTMSINGFELDFAKLAKLSSPQIVYRPPSRYPSIIRDVSLFVPMTTKAGEVEAIIRANMGELVQSLTLIDLFEQPEQHRKSFAFRMVVQSYEKTLSDEEANKVWDNVVAALEKTNPTWVVRK